MIINISLLVCESDFTTFYFTTDFHDIVSFDDLLSAIKNPKVTLSTFTAEAARQLKDKLPLFYGCEFLSEHISSMVGKLKRSGHSEDEAENFIHSFRDVTKTKKKEWTACVRKFYRGN